MCGLCFVVLLYLCGCSVSLLFRGLVCVCLCCFVYVVVCVLLRLFVLVWFGLLLCVVELCLLCVVYVM